MRTNMECSKKKGMQRLMHTQDLPRDWRPLARPSLGPARSETSPVVPPMLLYDPMLCLLSRTRVQIIGDPLLYTTADEEHGELDSRPLLAVFCRHLSQYNTYVRLKTIESPPLSLPVHKYKVSHVVIFAAQAYTLAVGRPVVTTNRTITPFLRMSSEPSSESNLRYLFETALTEYKRHAGTDILGHRLIVELQSCDSADAINAILQEQAQSFRGFRGDDGKLIRWLKRTVHVLYTLSTSSALGSAASLVR